MSLPSLYKQHRIARRYLGNFPLIFCVWLALLSTSGQAWETDFHHGLTKWLALQAADTYKGTKGPRGKGEAVKLFLGCVGLENYSAREIFP